MNEKFQEFKNLIESICMENKTLPTEDAEYLLFYSTEFILSIMKKIAKYPSKDENLKNARIKLLECDMWIRRTLYGNDFIKDLIKEHPEAFRGEMI